MRKDVSATKVLNEVAKYRMQNAIYHTAMIGFVGELPSDIHFEFDSLNWSPIAEDYSCAAI